MAPTPADGAPSVQNNGPAIRRKKPSSDPFFSGPKVRPPVKAGKPNGRPLPPANGHPVRQPVTTQLNALTPHPVNPSIRANIAPADRVSGFSDPQVVSGSVHYKDYKLVISKKDLVDGLRYHLLQLTGDKLVDIRSDAEFPKPARLHRRDPYAVAPGEAKEEIIDPKDGLNAAEREDLNRRKEIRQKEREANLAQIAPSQISSRKVPQFKKKSQQVFRADFTEEDKRRIQTNYEEKLPWHLEDFDSKHCFIGKNQGGSVNMHVGFLQEPASDGSTTRLRLVPIEKFYQFRRRKDYKYLNAEEAEAAMNPKKPKLPQWLEDVQSKRTDERVRSLAAKQAKTLFSGAQSANIAGRQGEEADLDFDEDFADDEEGFLLEDKDEDEKLAEKKIKEDLLKANVFDMKMAKEYDEEESKEKMEELARKEGSKKIRRALERRERNFNHGSDSEDESATDSEEERERLEREKLENVKKEEAETGKTSGIASGTLTPSGLKGGTGSDREGGMKKSSSSKSLKRPGSPNLSDASGTDTSTRKKHKSRHLSPGSIPSISRPHSPANLLGLSASNVRPRLPRVGSDSEMTGVSDREGGAGSEAERRRIKIKLNSPRTSRAASPSSSQAAPGLSISRPNSTAPAADQSQSSPSEHPPFPTVDAIRAEINKPGGATTKDMLLLLGRHQPESKRTEFIALVQSVAKLNKKTKLLEMRDQPS